MGFSTQGSVTEDKPLLSPGLCFLPHLSALQGLPPALPFSDLFRAKDLPDVSERPRFWRANVIPLLTVRVDTHP